MTVHELERRYKEHNPRGHFFDHDTLKFFGERKSDMRVLSHPAMVADELGTRRSCIVLSSLQRNHPTGARRTYYYFDTNTYQIV